jgi:hypothetical protein
MKALRIKTQRILAKLERDTRRAGLLHHLEAARALAANGLPVREIEFMTRWLFTKEAIAALRDAVKAKQH